MACRLAAILAADIVGYSRLMSEDETGTLEAVKAHRRDIFDPEVARHGGRIVKLMGDGALVEFPLGRGSGPMRHRRAGQIGSRGRPPDHAAHRGRVCSTNP